MKNKSSRISKKISGSKFVNEKILNNKIVLHLVFVVSFIMVMCYIMTNKLDLVVYFVVLGLITSYFSKNMIIVLAVPIVLVGLFSGLNRVKEGMVESNTNRGDGDDNKNAQNAKKEKKEENAKKEKKPVKKTEKFVTAKNENELHEIKRNRHKKGTDIDYAATVENAYDELNKILGGDGVKKLTEDTNHLMEQQMKLAEAMESFGPMMDKMGPLMDTASKFMNLNGGGSGSGSGSKDSKSKSGIPSGFNMDSLNAMSEMASKLTSSN
jgi:hypothetical protein